MWDANKNGFHKCQTGIVFAFLKIICNVLMKAGYGLTESSVYSCFIWAKSCKKGFTKKLNTTKNICVWFKSFKNDTIIYGKSKWGIASAETFRELIFAEIFWTHCRSETKSKWYFSGGAIHHSMFCRLYHFMGNLPKKKILLKGHYEVIQRNVQQSVRSTSRFGKVATKKASLITYYYFWFYKDKKEKFVYFFKICVFKLMPFWDYL